MDTKNSSIQDLRIATRNTWKSKLSGFGCPWDLTYSWSTGHPPKHFVLLLISWSGNQMSGCIQKPPWSKACPSTQLLLKAVRKSYITLLGPATGKYVRFHTYIKLIFMIKFKQIVQGEVILCKTLLALAVYKIQTPPPLKK